MRVLSFAVLCCVIIVGFGFDFWAWRTAFGAESAATHVVSDNPPQPSTEQKGPPDKASEEHLYKMQESVLKAVEQSNTKSKEEFDFAVLAVGFMGTMVLAVFGYFGLSTAIDSKALKAEAEGLIGE